MTRELAVGFDLDHTLAIDNQLERATALDSLADVARSRGATYDASAADATIDDVLVSFRSGAQTVEAAIAGFYERFVPGGSTRDVIDEASTFREAVLARVERHVTVVAGALAMLERLAALGIPYAILTNGWSPLQEAKARLIPFDAPVLVSERIGARKPAREAFDALAHAFDLPLEKIWYVGDDPLVDAAGARDAGLTSVWFDWENLAYPSTAAKPDHTIRDLGELPALLQSRLAEATESAS